MQPSPTPPAVAVAGHRAASRRPAGAALRASVSDARRGLAGTTLVVLAGSAGALLGSFVVRLVLARTLVPAELGRLTFALALVTVAGGIAGLGLPLLAAQRIASALAVGHHEAAGATARAAAWWALAAGLAVAAALGMAAPAFAMASGDPLLASPLRLLAPVAFGMAVGLAGLGIARGHGDVTARAIWRDGLGGAARLAGVATALVLAPGLAGAALGFAAGSLLADAVFVSRLVQRGFLVPGRQLDRGIGREVPPYLRMETLAQGGQWLDVLVLGWLAPAAMVGLYAVARSFGRVLELIAEAAGHRFLPDATTAWATGGGEALQRTYGRTQAFVIALTWPPLALCLIAPAPLVGALFGSTYVGAAPALRWLAGGVLLVVATGYAEKALVAGGRAREVVRARTLGLLAMGLAGVVAVPSFGAVGAALGWVAGCAVQRLLLVRYLARTLGVGAWGSDARAALARCVPPSLAVAALSPWLSGPAVAVAVVLAAAAGSAWAMWHGTMKATVGAGC
jgi:O-antigen/teichoic acid export membrane protein